MKHDDFFNKICDISSLHNGYLSSIKKSENGELFVEYSVNEFISLQDGRIQPPHTSSRQGFGVRSFVDHSVRYAYSNLLEKDEVIAATKKISTNCTSTDLDISIPLINYQKPSTELYQPDQYMQTHSYHQKIAFLEKMDHYARKKSSLVKQVNLSLASQWQAIHIVRSDGLIVQDIRPLVRLSCVVILQNGHKVESGSYSRGGRVGYQNIISEDSIQEFIDASIEQAEVNLQAIAAPAGELPVVLGNGWPGILLHEAIGHGFEADSIFKKTSIFHNMIGDKIASEDISVVDSGTINQQRGSIHFDDEGTTSASTILIEKGRIAGFLTDNMYAKLLKLKSTGNGRRENYKFPPLPRMTNTFMMSGNSCKNEMIESLKYGIYAKNFSDGQVDITSGKFVFSASEAYLIENGKITSPIKGAMLIGSGVEVLKHVTAVGNDFKMDNGVGTCGKDGQSVPVSVGQPSILINKITVGGTLTE